MVANLFKSNNDWFFLDSKSVEIFENMTFLHQTKYMIK